MNQIGEISLDYQVYCFDFFDTVVRRNVAPEYVKKLWCKEIVDYLHLPINADELYTTRNRIEEELCMNNQSNGLDQEFQYQEMINQIYDKLELSLTTDIYNFSSLAYDTELLIECRVQELNSDILLLLKNLKELGKIIVCVTDFYMPKNFIQQLLMLHKVQQYFDEIFVSSEYLMTKREGNLYSKVKAKYPGKRLLMLGDNEWSDCQMANKMELQGVLIDRSEQKKYYLNFLKEHENKDYISDHLNKLYESCNRDKYEDFSFTLYHFIDRLYSELKFQNVKDVFFLSREGEFLKRLFDYYQNARVSIPEKRINTHYLMVSRKSTFMASLKPLAEEKFEIIFRQYINISLFDFLSSLGFEQSIQNALSKLLNTDIYEKQSDLPNSEIFQLMLKSEYFQTQYESLRIQQQENFSQYLSDFNVDFKKNGFYLVDVGWKGTIQDNIFNFWNEEVRITGLYMGLVAPGKEHRLNEKKGLLFTNLPYPQKYFYIYDENKSLFEVILGASHGSADHYEKTDHKIRVVTSEKPEEHNLYVNVISPIQESIAEIFCKIDYILINHAYTKQSLISYWAGIHARMVFLPTKGQISLFYKIYHYENFGVFEFTKFKTRKKNGVITRIKNFQKMLTNRRTFFQSSFWGIIALKDSGLGLLVRPYGWYMYRRCYRKETVE